MNAEAPRVMKVLVVDDSRLLHKMYELALRAYPGCPVEPYFAADGREGLVQLQAHADIALILLDVNMPAMSGLEFLRQVKAEPAVAGIPVVMQSTEDQQGFVHDGAAVGGTYTLGGGDLRVRRGILELGGEVSYASSPDSSGFATALDAALRLSATAAISGRWLHLGDGFHNPAAVGLRSGTDEVGLSARAALGANELKFTHAWQRFATDDVSRRQTRASVARTLMPGLRASAGLSADQMVTGAASTSAQAGEFELA